MTSSPEWYCWRCAAQGTLRSARDHWHLWDSWDPEGILGFYETYPASVEVSLDWVNMPGAPTTGWRWVCGSCPVPLLEAEAEAILYHLGRLGTP